MPDYGWAYINLDVLKTIDAPPNVTGTIGIIKDQFTLSGSKFLAYATASNKVGIGLNFPTVVPSYQLDVSASVSETTAARFVGDLQVSGNAFISGNLNVNHLIADTVISSSNLIISDTVIGLGFGDPMTNTTGSVGDRGMVFGLEGNLNQAILWDQSSGSFVMGKVASQGPEAKAFDITEPNLGSLRLGQLTGAAGVSGAVGQFDSLSVGTTLTTLSAISGGSTLQIHGDITGSDTLYVSSVNDRVGVNAAAPAGELHVKSEGNDALLVKESGVIIGSTDSPNSKLYVNAEDDNMFQVRYSGGGGTELLFVSGSGRVGLGTTSPGSLLDVRGNISASSTLEIHGDITGSDTLYVSSVDDRVGINNSAPTVALDVTGDAKVSGDVYVASKIIHAGDTDTFINFTDDDINFQAGGVNFLDFTEDDSQDEVTFNEGGVDVDFRVETADESHMLFIEGSSNRMSIGDNTGSPGATLEIKNHATAGATGVPLLQLNNNDTDQQCVDINAGNIDANVVNITANDVTTARVLAIGADGLTTGNALYVDDNSSNTGTRNTALIIQNNAAAINAKALAIQSDGGKTGVKIDKNYSDTTEASVVGLDIDWDKTGASTSDNTMYGIQIDMDNTTATNGNNTMYGLHVTPTLTHAANAGTPIVYGALINAQGGTNGTSLVQGARIEAGGGDINYGIQLDVEDGGVDLRIESSADSGDYFQIQTTAHGATTFTTVDDDATAAHLTMTVDGDITLDPAGGDVFVDGNVSGSAILRIHGDITGSDTLYVSSVDDRVGINAAAPAGELHVKSEGNDALLVKESGVIIGSTDSPNSKLYVNAEDDNMFQVRYSGGGGTELLFVSGSGRVGLGTTSPGSLLDVRGNISASSTLEIHGSITGSDTLYVNADVDRVGIRRALPNAVLHLSQSGATDNEGKPMLLIETPGAAAGKQQSKPVFIVTSSIPDDYSEGRVGINTDNPNGVFHIKSKLDGETGNDTLVVHDNKVVIGDTNANAKFAIHNNKDTKNILRIDTTDDDDFRYGLFYVSGSGDTSRAGVFGSDATGSALAVSGSSRLSSVSVDYTGSVASDYTVKETDYAIEVDSSAGNVKVFVPSAASAGKGRILSIKDGGNNASSNNIKITGSTAGDLIEYGVEALITSNKGAKTIISDGVRKWFVIGSV